ncbi:MAG: hypothetical protein EXQ49_02745 [Acidobacteria bacterium]|nr:hypothetical protein [Acidobacteriota bacterium]
MFWPGRRRRRRRRRRRSPSPSGRSPRSPAGAALEAGIGTAAASPIESPAGLVGGIVATGAKATGAGAVGVFMAWGCRRVSCGR